LPLLLGPLLLFDLYVLASRRSLASPSRRTELAAAASAAVTTAIAVAVAVVAIIVIITATTTTTKAARRRLAAGAVRSSPRRRLDVSTSRPSFAARVTHPDGRSSFCCDRASRALAKWLRGE